MTSKQDDAVSNREQNLDQFPKNAPTAPMDISATKGGDEPNIVTSIVTLFALLLSLWLIMLAVFSADIPEYLSGYLLQIIISLGTFIIAGAPYIWEFVHCFSARRCRWEACIILACLTIYLPILLSVIYRGAAPEYTALFGPVCLVIVLVRLADRVWQKTQFLPQRIAARAQLVCSLGARLQMPGKQFSENISQSEPPRNADGAAGGYQAKIGVNEIVPADGVVISGQGLLSHSFLGTRGPYAVKGPGDTVLAGTTNTASEFTMQVSRLGDATYLAKASRWAGKYIPARARAKPPGDFVIACSTTASLLAGVSLITFFILDIAAGHAQAIAASATAALIASSLIMLNRNILYSVAANNIIRKGVLICDSSPLISAARARKMMIDPEALHASNQGIITDFHAYDAQDRQLRLMVVSALQFSFGKLARAVRNSEEFENIAPFPAELVEMSGSENLTVRCDYGAVKIGTPDYLQKSGIDIFIAEQFARGFRVQHKQTIGVALNGSLIGIIGYQEQLCNDSGAFIEALRRFGIEPALIINSGSEFARRLANALNINIEIIRTESTDDLQSRDKAAEGTAKARRSRSSPRATIIHLGPLCTDRPEKKAAAINIALGQDAALDNADLLAGDGDLTAIAHFIDIARKYNKSAVFGTLAIAVSILLSLAALIFIPSIIDRLALAIIAGLCAAATSHIAMQRS